MRENNLAVSKSATTEELILSLLGYGSTDKVERTSMDTKREMLMAHITKYWAAISIQLKCHAKNMHHPAAPDPRPCYKCTDGQVAACYRDNLQPNIR